MKRFIVLTFLLLAWGYWEMSGGAAFQPQPSEPLFAAVTVEEPGPDFGGFEIATRSADTTAAALTDLAEVPAADPAPVETLAAVLAVPEAPPIPEAVEEAAPVSAPQGDAWRRVEGDNVNVRSGPGREFEVVDQVTRGTLAEVIGQDPSGWMEVRIEPSGRIGWMSGDFLAPVDG